MGTRVPSASISPTDINRSARRPPELIPAGARKLARTQRSARGSAGRATSPGGRDPLRALQIIQRIFARNGGRRKVRPSACLVAAGGGKGSDPAAPIRSGRSQTMPSRAPARGPISTGPRCAPGWKMPWQDMASLGKGAQNRDSITRLPGKHSQRHRRHNFSR